MINYQTIIHSSWPLPNFVQHQNDILMKPTLFLSFVFCIMAHAFNAYSQCVPNTTHTAQGVYPDTITNLPHATIGYPYETTVTVVVPEDTMVTEPLPLTLTTVDFRLISIDGLPAGFTYECNPDSCVWPRDSYGCLLIIGDAPTAEMEGTYPLDIRIKGNFTSIIGPISRQGRLDGYELVIEGTSVGIQQLDKNKFSLAQNIPNPATGSTKIGFTIPNNGQLELKIYNAMGQMVLSKKVRAKKGKNEITIDTVEMVNGMYIYTLDNGTTILNKRMVIANK